MIASIIDTCWEATKAPSRREIEDFVRDLPTISPDPKCWTISWWVGCVLATHTGCTPFNGRQAFLAALKAHKFTVGKADRVVLSRGEVPVGWLDAMNLTALPIGGAPTQPSNPTSAAGSGAVPTSATADAAPEPPAVVSAGSSSVTSDGNQRQPVAISLAQQARGDGGIASVQVAAVISNSVAQAPVELVSSLAPGAGEGAGASPVPSPRVDERYQDAQSMVWHASALEEYQMCGMSYEHRYIKGIELPPTTSAAAGTGTHFGTEYLLKAKRDGLAVSAEELTVALAGEITRLWDEGLRLDEDEAAEISGTRDLLTAKVVRGVAQFQRQMLPQLEPADIELSFRIPETKWGFGLAGRMDLRDKGGVIWDWKTAHASGRQDDADDSEQLTIYGLAQRATEGTFPPGFALGRIVVTQKRFDATCERFDTYRCDDDYKRVIRKIRHIQRLVQMGAFAPCSHKSWKCSKKFCGYWAMCPFGNRQRTPRITKAE